MKLTRPIIFFDVESTGTDPAKDKIVKLSALRSSPSIQDAWLNAEFNPGFKMSDQVIAVHGITNEECELYPPFATHAKAIHGFFKGCDLGGYNLRNFDIPILWEELYRCGIEWDLDGTHVVDVGNIFKLKEPRTLSAAMKFYCGVDHEGAHNAKSDVLATKLVLDGQLKRYADMAEFDVPALAEFSKMDQRIDLAGKIVRDKDGDPSYAFGKCKGMKVSQDTSYAEWMLKSDFTQQTKMKIRKILEEIREWQ